MTDFVIVSRRMDRRGFRDTMFYTGQREYGVPLFDHDTGNAMRFTEDEANQVIFSESWPDYLEIGTLPVMDSDHDGQEISLKEDSL